MCDLTFAPYIKNLTPCTISCAYHLAKKKKNTGHPISFFLVNCSGTSRETRGTRRSRVVLRLTTYIFFRLGHPRCENRSCDSCSKLHRRQAEVRRSDHVDHRADKSVYLSTRMIAAGSDRLPRFASPLRRISVSNGARARTIHTHGAGDFSHLLRSASTTRRR